MEVVAAAAHAKGIPVVADIEPREANMHLAPYAHALITVSGWGTAGRETRQLSSGVRAY